MDVPASQRTTDDKTALLQQLAPLFPRIDNIQAGLPKNQFQNWEGMLSLEHRFDEEHLLPYWAERLGMSTCWHPAILCDS